MPIAQISREDVMVDTVAFINAPEIYFNVPQDQTGNAFKMEIEGRINVAGGGGGRLQFTGPAGAQIQGHGYIDNGAPAFFSGFESPIGGAGVGNGNHRFRVWALVQTGSTPGSIQLQIGLNSQPGSASMTLGRAAIEATRESASF